MTTFPEFVTWMKEYGISVGTYRLDISRCDCPKRVVIRTQTGDYELAAVHIDGDALVFDQGYKVEGA